MKKEDRELKKAWKAKQRLSAREGFPLQEDLLVSLFRFVEASVEGHGCDDTRRFTELLLTEHQQPMDHVGTWLDSTGGFCDCEVMMNSLDFWEQNR